MRIAMMAHHPKTVGEKLRLFAAGLIVEDAPVTKARIHNISEPNIPRYVPPPKSEPHDDNPPPED